jgi:16S rRNA (guanine527-N7)-methyltransferase
MDVEPGLMDALVESQRLGFLGTRPIDEVIEHARSFVRALTDLAEGEDVIDLGSGGGVPGLVIAHDRRDLHVSLLDRRAKRTDFLERMVRRLGWQSQITVVADEAEAFIRRTTPSFAAAVARGFGPPAVTLGIARQMIRPGGLIVISEPPDGDRWATSLLDQHDVERFAVADGEQVARFVRRSAST